MAQEMYHSKHLNQAPPNGTRNVPTVNTSTRHPLMAQEMYPQ